MQKLYIPIILGTGRDGRESEKVAQFILGELKKRDDVDTEIIDTREYVKSHITIPAWVDDERTMPWRKIAKKAAGFLIVVPEYNHGYPGELKLLLDSAMEEYSKKPVALCSVSSGRFGGARVIENLWPVVLGLGMVPVMNPLYFSNITDTFNEDGSIKDEKTVKYTSRFIDGICWFSRVLKFGEDSYDKVCSYGK